MIEFLVRLRQRKLVQWALAYTAAAFALIQILDIVGQRFGWPEQMMRFVILAICVGFFATLVLAWYHGERGAQHVTSAELMILALLLAIGGVVTWRFVPRAPGGIPAASAPLPAADQKSIAVLPFVNMSGDKDNDYFSDGISEEILNVLAGIPDLRVAARTSSFSFRDGKHEAPEIAQELRVRMLLEGSVRKQGDRARITAQLIDASNGYHLWSQTYDRELKDVFAVQDEIAAAVAKELKVKITGAVDAPTHARDMRANDSYLRGLSHWQQRGEGPLLAAIKDFDAAVEADPTFAAAYAGRAITYTILPDYSASISYAQALDRARDDAEIALALDPSVPETFIVLGYLADGDRRRVTAQALYQRALELRPSFATAYQWLGNSLWSAGDLEGGLAMLERASALDPRSAIIANNHGMVLIALGRPAEAIALCAPTLRDGTPNQNCAESTAFAMLVAGDLEGARAAYQRYTQLTNPLALPLANEVFDALEGRGDRAAVAARLARFGPQSSYDPASGNVFGVYVIPVLLVMLGSPQLVVPNLDAFAMSDRSGQTEWAMMMKSLGTVHCDLAFAALVARVKTKDPYHAALCTER